MDKNISIYVINFLLALSIAGVSFEQGEDKLGALFVVFAFGCLTAAVIETQE